MNRTQLKRRLSRVEGALAVPPAAGDAACEVADIADELGQAFGLMVDHYRRHYGHSPDEARAQAAGSPDQYLDRALTCPPSQLSWFELEAIARRDPARAMERWEEVKRAARAEVTSGHRAARVAEGCDSNCWSRARFLAVRTELAAAWRPRNAAEQHLIDQLAQWQTLTWHWLAAVTAYTELAASSRRCRICRPDGHNGPALLSDADAVDRATKLAETFHALYLKTLRALRDLRRQPPVVVRAAGQVNIGHQQVNVGGAGVG
jgi:hypothetical protein